jgi:hypothetical protein
MNGDNTGRVLLQREVVYDLYGFIYTFVLHSCYSAVQLEAD